MLFDASIKIITKIQDILLVNYDTVVVYHLDWNPQEPGQWKARVLATRYGFPYYFVFATHGDRILSWDDQDAPLSNNRYLFGAEIAPETRKNMQIEKFTRRPFEVNAVQVSPQNTAEVAEWCGGKVSTGTYKIAGFDATMDVVMVPGNGPNKGKLIEARIGTFVVEHDGNFRVFRRGLFQEMFVKPVADDMKLRPEDLVEVIDPKDPHYGFQGEVEFVQQACVTIPGVGGVMYNPFDLKRIDEYSDETMERIKEEARVAAIQPTQNLDALDKINAIRAAAEAGMQIDIPVQGSVETQELREPVTEINGIKTGYKIRVKLEANMYYGETGTVVGLGKDGVRVLVVLDQNAERDLTEPIPFQADELEVVEKTKPGQTLTLDERWVNDMVEVSKEGHHRHGQTGRVTVVGCDPEGHSDQYIEVLFSDGEYGHFLPTELVWN